MDAQSQPRPTLDQLYALVDTALAGAIAFNLAPAPGLKLMNADTPTFVRLFYLTRCTCGTTAVLSAEIDKSKTFEDVVEALPGLVATLSQQAASFYAMPCDVHASRAMGKRRKKPSP